MKVKSTFRVGLQTIGLSRSQWWTARRIEQFQKDRLVQMLRYAVTNVPYYASLNIKPDSIVSVEDIKRFPVLKKSMVQELGDELIAHSFPKDSLYFSRTSGSSGEPTTTYFDENSWLMSKYSLKIRRMTANKVGLFKHVVIVSELRNKEIRNIQSLPFSQFLFKKTLLSIYDSVQDHLSFLKDTTIDAIYGFPSYFDELIQYCELHNINLPSIPVVFTSSEVLRPMLREKIGKFFGAKVCDIYGSTEFKEVAWQCEYGQYHLNFESVWAENMNSKEDDANYKNTFLLTSLHNKAMPLIRYQVGDLVEVKIQKCACGRNSSVLQSISGREIEMMCLPGGKKISPYLLTTVIEENNLISKYQIRQVAENQLDILYVAQKIKPDEADDLALTIGKIIKQIGNDVSINFHEVESISSNTAKHQIFVREIESVVR